MSGFRPEIPKDLLVRYGTSAPRYTSYPTAIDWRHDLDPHGYSARLASAAAADGPVSAYVHIPFCEQLCLYCGCNVVITRDHGKSAPYLDTLESEIAAVAATGIARRPVSQFHWGGGTPTFLSSDEMKRLFHAFTSRFTLTEDAEVAIEVDPRFTTLEQVRTLGALGFNRMSMGVQDFDPKVQKAVNRVQSIEQTRAILDACRANGFKSVNIDLIYGLPHQHREQFRRTLDLTLDMAPDRVALFHYAHVPWIRKHQEVMPDDAFPSSDEKSAIFADAVEAFTARGYRWIGLDHFAAPGDELAVARDAGTLDRNFMGYTTRRGTDLLPFGITSIGEIGGAFVQNAHTVDAWASAVASRGTACERGHVLDADDRLRRDVILALMCNGRVDIPIVASRHGVDFPERFARELAELRPMADDGLVLLEDDAIVVTPLGQVFLRNIALPFDAYTRRRRETGEGTARTFSRTT